MAQANRRVKTGTAPRPNLESVESVLNALDSQAEVEQQEARDAEFSNRALEAQYHLGVRAGIQRAARMLRHAADA